MYDIDLLHSIWINCRVTFIKPGTKVVQYHFFVSNGASLSNRLIYCDEKQW